MQTNGSNGKSEYDIVFAPKQTALFDKISGLTNLVETKPGSFTGCCPLVNHPANRKNTFYYYASNDNFACYACPPNNKTGNGRAVCSGDLAVFDEKLNEAKIPVMLDDDPKSEKLPRSNGIVRLDIRLLSALLLTTLTTEQAKAIQLLMCQSLGRKVSEAESGKVLASLMMLPSKDQN